MRRRHFIGVTASAGLAAGAPTAAATPAIFELRYFHLRNGSQVDHTSDFLSRFFLPAAWRCGVSPMGFFSAVIAE
ncbi:MAG TPA: hypothetical protein VG675_16000 [Bryobacteraceae bacterium]|nr:hypothetical protein [Bryobacteraceae bacterium]